MIARLGGLREVVRIMKSEQYTETEPNEQVNYDFLYIYFLQQNNNTHFLKHNFTIINRR